MTVTASETLVELIARVRNGDQEAAAQLVMEYEPIVRRVVRLKLGDHRLQRAFDSMDFCQSVLASFFVRAASGEFELKEPSNLINLLATMARNKVVSVTRQEYRHRRDVRRITSSDTQQLNNLHKETETPSVILAGKELLMRAAELMNHEEKKISALRAAGLSWDQVAQDIGGTAQARRIQFARTMRRVLNQLGIDQDLDAR